MDLANKKVVVTGGAGFVGARVIERLKTRGVPAENIRVPLREEFDLRKKTDCERAVSSANVVIHLAGITGNPLFHIEHAGEMFYDNLTMGAELMEAARRAGAEKFIGIGSATEYPARAAMPLDEGGLWNGPLAGPHVPYSWAKKMMLVQGEAYKAQYGFTALHLMPTNMYGPWERLDNGFVIPMLITRFAEAKRTGTPNVTVWGTGSPTRDFLYVDDAAEAIVLAVEKYDSPDPVNIGSGAETSIKELAELVKKITGYEGEIIWDVSKPDGEPRRVLDVRKAEESFGFKAQVPLEIGLEKTVHWYQENK
ncbi:MAG: NAD-dependent epimerase/dehydratase family protein [Candidatus Liptonbacteria bacterium]